MNAIYGLANTSICTAHIFYSNLKTKAEKKGQGFPKLKILDLESSKIPDNSIVFVPSVALFLSKRKLLNSSAAVVYVFDCAVQCEYLSPIKILDLQEKLESYCYQFKKITEKDFEKSLRQKGKVMVSKSDIQIIPELIGNINESILSPVMKFLYCVPNPIERHRYGSMLAKWFFSEKSVDVLSARLYKAIKIQNHFAVDDLIAFFETAEGKKLKKVAAEIGDVSPKPAQVREISKKYGVKDYEVLYIASLNKKAEEIKHINKSSKEIDKELRQRYTVVWTLYPCTIKALLISAKENSSLTLGNMVTFNPPRRAYVTEKNSVKEGHQVYVHGMDIEHTVIENNNGDVSILDTSKYSFKFDPNTNSFAEAELRLQGMKTPRITASNSNTNAVHPK